MAYLINHTKCFIVEVPLSAKINISKTLCEAIRDNLWSITDQIEFAEYLHCDHIYLQKLIEEKYYFCDTVTSRNFYL